MRACVVVLGLPPDGLPPQAFRRISERLYASVLRPRAELPRGKLLAFALQLVTAEWALSGLIRTLVRRYAGSSVDGRFSPAERAANGAHRTPRA